ncbi:ABC transporter ATP-binding protein [Vogesella fluminis]|uniref:ABC transporter ATP-binding protein n=1 Tax=Vogesella fluminis TaxID=1069161 RepID=UPI003636009A
MIELHAVCRRFGAQLAVNQVSLTVAPGELFGLIGHNGAGKSTLFKLMLGLLAPDSGDILLDGVSIRGASFRDVRRRIGYLPENVVLYDNLSASETLAFYARLKGVPLTACAPLLAEVGLADAAARRVGTYSKGMRQRLALPRHYWAARNCCCWTNPPPAWIRKASTTSTASSRHGARTAAP